MPRDLGELALLDRFADGRGVGTGGAEDYAAAERGSLPGDAWLLLDNRLHRSFWWPNWDKCVRIRQTVVGMYMDREIDAASFLKVTERDDVFAELIDVVADSFGGQRYLKSLRDRLTESGVGGKRLRLVMRALW